MRRKRKRLSFGTTAMLILLAVVLCCTAWAVISIRGGRDVLSMDAQRLSGSINALVAAVQPSTAPEITVNVVVTQPPVTAEIVMPPSQEISAPVTQTPVPTAAVRALSLTVGGEFIPSNKLNNGTLDKGSGQYVPQNLFAGISDALHADVNIVMLDAVAAEQQAGWWAQAAKSAGFDWVIPCGEKPLSNAQEQVLQQLSAQGLTVAGVNGSEGYTLHMVNGVRLAVLSYTEHAGEAGWLPPYDAQAAANAIAQARARGAELVLVCMHWKKGTATEPTAAQKSIAQALCNDGADIIFGVRNEMVYPVQYLESAASPAHKTLVAWSLGTLLSDSRADRAAVSSMLLHIDILYNARDKTMDFTTVEYTPCYTWGQEEDGVFRYRVLQSAKGAPDGMNVRQKDILTRSLKLIQDTMGQGIAAQR